MLPGGLISLQAFFSSTFVETINKVVVLVTYQSNHDYMITNVSMKKRNSTCATCNKSQNTLACVSKITPVMIT